MNDQLQISGISAALTGFQESNTQQVPASEFIYSGEPQEVKGHVLLRLVDHHLERAPQTIQKWPACGGWKARYASRFLTHVNPHGDITRSWWINIDGYDLVAAELGWKPFPVDEKQRILARVERTRMSNQEAAKN